VSFSYSEALVRLGLRPAGGNHATLKKHLTVWGISTAHFDPWRNVRPAREATPLAAILVERSTYPRNHLKRRLLAEGIKQRSCELCGQGEEWRGGRMALVLDHINGVWDDNRLKNLRILCPNCNATLDTHCGRKNKRERAERACAHCGERFRPRARRQRFCSRRCGVRHNAPASRRVERPSYDELRRELAGSSFVAVGRRYGVSDNAIRKWLAAYEREAAHQPPSASQPPSTATALPVTNEASSEARKATTRAISAGSAQRPIGVRRSMSAVV
jgi:transposase-like protein